MSPLPPNLAMVKERAQLGAAFRVLRAIAGGGLRAQVLQLDFIRGERHGDGGLEGSVRKEWIAGSCLRAVAASADADIFADTDALRDVRRGDIAGERKCDLALHGATRGRAIAQLEPGDEPGVGDDGEHELVEYDEGAGAVGAVGGLQAELAAREVELERALQALQKAGQGSGLRQRVEQRDRRLECVGRARHPRWGRARRRLARCIVSELCGGSRNSVLLHVVRFVG